MDITGEVLAAFITTVVAVVCGTVLAATGHAVPEAIWLLAGVGSVGGVGATVPRLTQPNLPQSTVLPTQPNPATPAGPAPSGPPSV